MIPCGIRQLYLKNKDYYPLDRRSYLSDQSMQKIARCCPQLQVLDVSHQKLLTIEGLKIVVASCPLVKLNVRDTTIEVSEALTDLVQPSTTLLALEFGPNRFKLDDAARTLLQEAIIACQSRNCFYYYVDARCRYDLSTEQGLFSDLIFDRQKEAIRRLDKIAALERRAAENLDFTNTWEWETTTSSN
jgi:hypothetical protein